MTTFLLSRAVGMSRTTGPVEQQPNRISELRNTSHVPKGGSSFVSLPAASTTSCCLGNAPHVTMAAGASSPVSVAAACTSFGAAAAWSAQPTGGNFSRPRISLRSVSQRATGRTATVQEIKIRISETFLELKKQGKVAFIPYVTAGDPNLYTTAKALKLLDNCGANIIELGIPYSDPLADGAIIQAAATRAISGGTNLDSVLTMMRAVLPGLSAPVIVFLYYNALLKRGVQRFLEEAKAVGVSGLVIPDLPLEEAAKLTQLTDTAGLELILLTTPTTPISCMEAISDTTQGFVYLVSLTGVTGARSSIDNRVEGLLNDIRKVTEKPVAVGFGISTVEQAVMLRKWGADGVIIGSKVVKLLGESGTPEEGLQALEAFGLSVRDVLL